MYREFNNCSYHSFIGSESDFKQFKVEHLRLFKEVVCIKGYKKKIAIVSCNWRSKLVEIFDEISHIFELRL